MLSVNYWGSVHYNYECLDATIYRLRAKLVSIIGKTISWWGDDLSMIGNILSGDSIVWKSRIRKVVFVCMQMYCIWVVSYWQYHYIHFVQYVYDAMIFNCNLLVNCIELVTCWRIRRTRKWEQLLSLRNGYIQCIDQSIHVYKDIVFGILQLICAIACNSVLHLVIMIVAMHL